METVTIDGVAYVTLAALAEDRGVTRAALHMAARAGRLPTRLWDGRTLVPADAAAAWQPQARGGYRGGGRPRKGEAGDGNDGGRD